MVGLLHANKSLVTLQCTTRILAQDGEDRPGYLHTFRVSSIDYSAQSVVKQHSTQRSTSTGDAVIET